jgi:hypothetical protein
MLPISAIIIIVLGVIVLIAVLGIFMLVWKPAGRVGLDAATRAACMEVHTRGLCKDNWLNKVYIRYFDANMDGNINPGPAYILEDNLGILCMKYYGCPPYYGGTADQKKFIICCNKEVCGCP